MSLPLNKLLSGYAISDEVINRTSSTAIALEHSLIKQAGLEIWTGANKTGTKLTVSTDYAYSDLNSAYTTEAGENIYEKLAITNGAYHGMALYVSYVTIGDMTSVEKIAQASMETLLKTASFTLSSFGIGQRKRIINAGSSTITVTMASGVTCYGRSTITIQSGRFLDVEVVSSSTIIITGGDAAQDTTATPAFTLASGSYQLKQRGNIYFIRFAAGFGTRTLTAGQQIVSFSGLFTGYSGTIRTWVSVDTDTVRTTAGADIVINTNGTAIVNIYPNGDRATSGGTIVNAVSIACDSVIEVW